MMLAVIMSMGLVVPNEVQASETTEVVYVDGSALTEDKESSFTVYPRMRGVYLLQGTGTITVPGSGLVGCSASTTATGVVSKLSVGVRLERYVNGSWTSVSAWNNTAYNTYVVSTYKGVSVTGGYYYRVVAEHSVLTDWTMGATSGVWVAK